MLHSVYLMKQITLLNTLSEEDMLNNLRSGAFRISRYKKNSIIHFEGENVQNLKLFCPERLLLII